MEWIRRVLHVPATETQTGVVLGVCIFAMSVMSIVLVWQAQIIANQKAVIRMFESRFGASTLAHFAFRGASNLFFFSSPSNDQRTVVQSLGREFG